MSGFEEGELGEVLEILNLDMDKRGTVLYRYN